MKLRVQWLHWTSSSCSSLQRWLTSWSATLTGTLAAVCQTVDISWDWSMTFLTVCPDVTGLPTGPLFSLKITHWLALRVTSCRATGHPFTTFLCTSLLVKVSLFFLSRSQTIQLVWLSFFLVVLSFWRSFCQLARPFGFQSAHWLTYLFNWHSANYIFI